MISLTEEELNPSIVHTLAESIDFVNITAVRANNRTRLEFRIHSSI